MVRLIQERRKELDCQFTDRIEVAIVGAEGELAAAIDEFADYIQRETLANSISTQTHGGEAVAHEVAEMSITLSVKVSDSDSSAEASTEG